MKLYARIELRLAIGYIGLYSVLLLGVSDSILHQLIVHMVVFPGDRKDCPSLKKQLNSPSAQICFKSRNIPIWKRLKRIVESSSWLHTGLPKIQTLCLRVLSRRSLNSGTLGHAPSRLFHAHCPQVRNFFLTPTLMLP